MASIIQIQEEKRSFVPHISTLRPDYAKFLAGYKTPAAKKAAMTKEIKATMDFITDLQGQFAKRKGGSGTVWLHGLQWHEFELRRAVQNLSVMFQIKAEIKGEDGAVNGFHHNVKVSSDFEESIGE